MLYTLFRYLHFLAIFSLAGALIIKNMAIKPVIKDEDAHNLAKVNAIYSLSAVLAFVFGLVLWLWVGKPAEFYALNPFIPAQTGSVCLHCLAFCLSIAILYKKLQGQEPRDSRTAINPDAYQDRAGAFSFLFQ